MAMGWRRISIPVASDDVDALSEAFETLGALAVSFEDAGDDPKFEPDVGATPLWGHTIVTGLFEASVDPLATTEQLSARFPGAALAKVDELSEDELRERSIQSSAPCEIGQRIWVGPHDVEPPSERDVVIRLAPGLAFGTGRHPTTAMCLAGLETHMPADARIVDFGCGSGILAIGALKLGARYAWAIDIDPQALHSTELNAQANGVSDAVHVGDTHVGIDGPVDIVAANILAQPLMQLAPTIAALVRTGGIILLSGILRTQTREVRERYAPWFDVQADECCDDWAMLVGKRTLGAVTAVRAQ